MNNLNWNIIFKLKVFSDYISNSDLIQLSTCSKKSRYLLTNYTLKTLNFNSIVSNKKYSSLLIKEEVGQYGPINICINPFKPLTGELADSKKKFSNDLKLLDGYPKNLVVNDFGRYYYLLNEIPSIFPNIVNLVLSNSAFTLDTFQYLLDNFKCLENLELTENIIFHNVEFSNEYIITYPTSLRSLKLDQNGIMMVQDKINSIDIKKYRYANTLHNFNLPYQHLPNLVTFDYEAECDYPEENGDLFVFIKLNPQLKSLRFALFPFNLDLFYIIKNYENLTHFELNCYIHPEDIEDYELPVLRNMKHLHIDLGSNHVDDDKKIINSFPNVEELVIEYDGRLNYFDNCLIENMSNLKYLKFISKIEYKYDEYLILPTLNNLETLESNFDYRDSEYDPIKVDVSDCNRLKLIAYTKNANYTPFKNSEVNQELVKNWNYLYFPHKLSFHKNS